MTDRSLDDARRWVREGTKLAGDAMAGLTEESFGRPSGLPAWTRQHLVAHLAANADALRNLVHWAATGERWPMYASAEQRHADIAARAARTGAELVADFDRSAAALDAAMAGLSDTQWRAEVVTAQGRTVPAAEIPWLRAREVLVHAVDLDAGVAFEDLPADFLLALVDDIVAKRNRDGHGPALEVAPTDSPRRWTLTGRGPATTATGPLASLAAYLAGRRPGVPQLPPWL